MPDFVNSHLLKQTKPKDENLFLFIDIIIPVYWLVSFFLSGCCFQITLDHHTIKCIHLTLVEAKPHKTIQQMFICARLLDFSRKKHFSKYTAGTLRFASAPIFDSFPHYEF